MSTVSVSLFTQPEFSSMIKEKKSPISNNNGNPMTKGIPAPNVKAAIGTAALLASGASTKGGGDEEVVVACFQISSKHGLNDEPPPNLTVAEKVIAETAPFQMIRQKRSMDQWRSLREDEAGGEIAEKLVEGGEEVAAKDPKPKKEKKKKKPKKKDKKSKKRKLLGMEPPQADGSSDSSGSEIGLGEKIRHIISRKEDK